MTMETPRKSKAAGRAIFAVLLLAAVLLPLFVDDFQTFQFTQVLVLAVAIMGLNLLTGFSGQFSLGHGAFFAAGAYVVAYLVGNELAPFPVALVAAGAFCFVMGLAFGFPALKLDGIYLALATFSLAVAVPQILKLSVLEHWTGGVGGIVLMKPPVPAWLPISEDQWLFYIVLVTGLILYALVTNLLAGRTGRAMLAVKDNALAARAMGINVTHTKVLAFGYSALVTGMAGGLSAMATQYVAPDSFTLFVSINLLVGLVVGGVGWIPGALAGAAFIYFLPTLAENVSQGMQGVVYGVVLIAVMYFAPKGLGAFVRR
ncbi:MULTISPECIES: branched-chain amino acid ABC transporter permease [unclassified Haematobacter]|uniref:branched-chain amino acid ABC transporter permease n=1 Tax=unclassified Haematobacter TaxID=2640585 RepID=UPI0025C6E9CA|nr:MULTISPECIES: branched-chain amino acid ABC transporter permease [unclassified Haematobacter]